MTAIETFRSTTKDRPRSRSIGIERSRAAWQELVGGRVVSEAQAQPFLTELAWLGSELEQVFPLARAFVRPGFDEPDALATLL